MTPGDLRLQKSPGRANDRVQRNKRGVSKPALRERPRAHLLRLGLAYRAEERAGEVATAAAEGVGHMLGCFGGAREGIKVTKGVAGERRIMATERGKE